MPNAWVQIGSDNSITILCARSEMGQGVYTALPTLVAEELEVDLAKIKVEIAPAGEPYINAMLGGQLTGGSTSVRDGYDKLRIAGAQARTDARVRRRPQKWGVDAVRVPRAERRRCMGPAGQKASYGELAEAASKLPAAEGRRSSRRQGLALRRQAVSTASTPPARSTARPSSAST